MSNLSRDALKDLFHSRSSCVSLGTSSLKGDVDVAPVGSAFMRDDSTIVLLRGPLRQSYRNLLENPEAVFMVLNTSSLRWMKFFFTGNFGAPFGCRIHARLKEEKALAGAEKQEVLKERFGFGAGLKGGQKIGSTLTQMLIFDITQIRDITPF